MIILILTHEKRSFAFTMWIYVPSVLIAVVYLLYWFSTRTLNYWKDRNIAGPKPVPFFGNTKESVFRRRHLGDVLKDIYNQYRGEKVIGIFRMTSPTLLVTDLDLIKDVLIKNFDYFADRGSEFSNEGLGANLFNAGEQIWRLLRHRFSPMFTSGKLKNMFHLLDERSNIFMEYLTGGASKKSEHEIKSLLQKYTISAISACAFGMDIDLHDTANLEVLYKLDKLMLSQNYVFEFDQLFPGYLKMLNINPMPADVTNFFNKLVKETFEKRNWKPSGRKDFMDLILELTEDGEVQGTKGNSDQGEAVLKITESVTAAQAFIFFVAGYETSASTMTYLLYELAKNPRIQDKLIAEVDEVTERHDGKVTYDSLSEMTYLNKVFDETLRMYPILETLVRCAKKDYKLPGTELVVKKGQIVLVPTLSIHRDAKYYPDPEIFDPERFSPDNVKDRHSCAYLPFGTGPRNCIGMRFGKIQSALCIAKLLTKFRVEPSPRTPKTIDIDPNRIVYSVRGDVYLNFVQRR